MEETLKLSGAQRMISLSGPGKTPARPTQIQREFLSLEFNDIAEPQDGLIAPDENVVKNLVDFGDRWNQQGNLLIHCWMGISRSTAAAVVILASLNTQRNMQRLADDLRNRAPEATPNPLMISIADRMLELDGRLVTAIHSIGRGREAIEGKPFFMDNIS